MSREAIVRLACQLENVPYLWNGNGVQPDGTVAFDCSGFICFVLRPFGLVTKDEWTVPLMQRFQPTNAPQPGDLMFYGDHPNHPFHVMMLVSASEVIGARGGGSGTTSVEIARLQKAGVHRRPSPSAAPATSFYRTKVIGYRDIMLPVPE